MLSGITITCFAASYAVTLGLELSRLFLRASVRMALIVGFASAGLFAHTVYLVLQGSEALQAGETGVPLSSWYHWCLIAAWVVALIYLSMILNYPRTAVGLFVLPTALLLIALAYVFRGSDPFPGREAYAIWSTIHGLSLLLGTVTVLIGFLAGLMYLIHSYRLKHKLPPRQGFRLPSLEWLQTAGRRALLTSTLLLVIGLGSGIVMNAIQHRHEPDALPWTDPVVYTSGILLVWLVAASIFELFYKPARQGQKVAYLTFANFAFLMLVLGIVLFGPSQHATRTTRTPQTSSCRVPLLACPTVPCSTVPEVSGGWRLAEQDPARRPHEVPPVGPTFASHTMGGPR